MRANLLDELHKPYVDTARAKGLPEWRLLIKYPLRHAMNPFVSGFAYLLPFLVAGEAIVAYVLNLQTEGPVLLNALLNLDVFLAGGFLLLLSLLTVIGTLLSDLLLAWLDPRIRYEKS
jgi:peptide/nickel transport system permease protein